MQLTLYHMFFLLNARSEILESPVDFLLLGQFTFELLLSRLVTVLAAHHAIRGPKKTLLVWVALLS